MAEAARGGRGECGGVREGGGAHQRGAHHQASDAAEAVDADLERGGGGEWRGGVESVPRRPSLLPHRRRAHAPAPQRAAQRGPDRGAAARKWAARSVAGPGCARNPQSVGVAAPRGACHVPPPPPPQRSLTRIFSGLASVAWAVTCSALEREG